MSSHLFILLFTYCYSLGVRYIAVTLGHKQASDSSKCSISDSVFYCKLQLARHCNEVKITWLTGAFPSPGWCQPLTTSLLNGLHHPFNLKLDKQFRKGWILYMISKWEDIPNVVASLTQLWLWAQKPHKPAVQTFHLWQETNQNIFILCLVSKKMWNLNLMLTCG